MAQFSGGRSLPYENYQLQALATDKKGNVDPAPQTVEVRYADLTPPVMMGGLAAKVNGAAVSLSWTASTESDLDGYNVYRIVSQENSRTKVNNTLLKQTSYTDSVVPDGLYGYEVTAVDTLGNESKASEQVAARIYAPVVTQLFTPVKTSATAIEGTSATPGSSTVITVVSPTGQTTTTTVPADESGAFKMNGVTLAQGENRYTAVVTDAQGNISRPSETMVVVYDTPPAAPTGLAATVQPNLVGLTWNPNGEADILGYNVYLKGEKVNAGAVVSGGQATASYEYYPAKNAIDGNVGTYWQSPYTDGTFLPVWWQVTLPSKELINRINISWAIDPYNWDSINHRYNTYAGKDYEIQVWTGYAWLTIKKISANQEQDNWIDISPAYRTDKLRLKIDSTTDTGYSKLVRINEVRIWKDNLVATPSYNHANYEASGYAYTVTAVDSYGFESEPSGYYDVVPPSAPTNILATAQASSVILDWNLTGNAETDLAGFNVYRKSGQDWIKLGSTTAVIKTYEDVDLKNGEYYYRLTAFDQAGNESLPSNEAVATVKIAVPTVPVALTVSVVPTGKALRASWQAAGGTVAYNLYRSTTPGVGYLRVNASPITALNYIDRGLTNGIAYYYVVVATDDVGNESPYSNEAVGMPQRSLTLQPSILYPTVAGVPTTVYQNKVDLAGIAEPDMHVDIFHGDSVQDSVSSSVEPKQTDKAIVADNINDISESAAITQDGKYLAYQVDQYLLQIQNLVDGSVVDVPVPAGMNYFSTAPKWSPDGRYLVTVADWSAHKIVVYDRETATYRLIAIGEFSNGYGEPSWSADSKEILFTSYSSSYQPSLWSANIASAVATRLTADGAGGYYPQLSPDANKIAFFKDNALYLLDRKDNSTLLIDDNTDGSTASWSPDASSRLAFISYRDDEGGKVYLYNSENGGISQYSSSEDDPENLAWSPDGKQMGVISYNDESSKSILSVINLYGQEEPLYTLDDSMRGLQVGPLWLVTGELAVVDDKGAHYIQPAGYFKSSMISLFAGENYLHAVAKDEVGNISQSSDSITVVYDTGRLPDLVIASDDLSIYPQFPKPGEDVLVTARIHNPANNAVDNVPVSFYLWNGSDDISLIKSDTITHIDANGEETVSFKLGTGSIITSSTIIAYVDPENAISEVVETNNSTAKDIVITGQQNVQLESVLNSSKYTLNQDVLINITLMNSGSATSGVLRVIVEDSSGNLVKVLKEEYLELPYGLNTKLAFTWSTASNYSGEYKVHTIVTTGGDNSVLAEVSNQFIIVPDIKVSGGLTLGKQEYISGEDVVLGVSYANNSSNYLMPRLTSRVRITDTQGAQVFVDEKPFTNILPGASGSYSVYWNTGGVVATSSYVASLEVVADEQVLATQSATIHVTVPVSEKLNLAGTLVVVSPVVAGGSVPVSYTVTNKGLVPAVGTLRMSLLDPDTQYVISSSEQPCSIGGNAAISGNSTFNASSLALKTYQIVLQYVAGANIQTLAKSMVVVKDGIAPSVSVLLPVQGANYTKEVVVSAVVTDDASGVDIVEYAIDNGIWQALPLVDPAKSLYYTIWLAQEKASGQHLVAIRGKDKAGNISQPITTGFTILSDVTPPVLTVSTLADGAYTNTDVLNITGIVTDDGGVKELRINDVSIPVNPDGSFTYALQLKSGANRIAVVATDLAGNLSDNNRTINLDQSAPLLVIITPADNSKTASAQLDVSGTVDETSIVVLKLGGIEQPTQLIDKSFSSSVTLVPGINTIEVTATDGAGNTSSQKRTVIFDDQKPALAITFPAQDIRTNKSDITITGAVSDPYTAVTVSILIEGMTYTPTVVNGQFEQQITFTTEKSYPIVVTASNEVGATTTVQRNVIYDVTPPGLTINPVTTPTQASEQIISGTRESKTTVTVTCPTAVVGTIEYPGDTAWRVTITNLVVGENTITAEAIDETGNIATVFSKITVITSSTEPIFSYAVFGNTGAVLSGTSSTDSYNSHYTGKREDLHVSHESCPQTKHGNVGTNSVSPCSIQLRGKASILGKALVGNGGNPSKGVCQTWGTYVSGIGSLAKAKDMRPMIDPGGGQVMGALNLSGRSKKKLAGGVYRFTGISVSGSAVFTLSGKTTIYIDGNLSVTGNGRIDITPDASVTVFVNGARVDISGDSIVNQSKNPRGLVIYGSSGLKKVNLAGCAKLYGLIYAPMADIGISGNQQIYGSVIGNRVDLSGNGAVHYDETLAKHE